ncbi:MAG: YhdP family protein [Comamonas sp.]
MAGVARWSLGLLLAFWLLLATVWGVLHGFIVPRISEYRPQLESLAARTLGVPVRIGAITARSEGLIPVIELGQVALQGADGQPALELPRVVVAVSPRSLLRLGVEQLFIDAPLLEARRDSAGQLWIAGLPLPAASESQDNPAADWLFSQTEIAIRSGQLRWTDELRQAPPLALKDLDFVVRNKGWRHQIRLDATPDNEWGARFTLSAQLRQPLLSAHAGNWRRWTGQAYADFAQLDVARLGQYIDLQGASVSQGRGALRAWVDIKRGQVEQVTTDLVLSAVETRLRPDLPPLALRALQGRLSVARLPGGYALNGQALTFETGDGLRWPASQFSLRHSQADAAAAEFGALGEQGELRFEQFDLAIAAQLASRLPIADAARSRLLALAPRGIVKALQANWRGPMDKPLQYEMSGEVQDLALSDQPAAKGTGVPGVEGLQAKFSLNQLGGSAQLSMTGGALRLPGVFEEPVLPLDNLSGALRWQVQGEQIELQASDMRFSNADAEGEAQATWHTGRDAAKRFPGVLALTGTLRNADGSRVHRYLPLEIPADARHYVRDSVQSGRASRVQFKVQGDLDKLPFERGDGEFRIAAEVHDVNYVYVPPGLQSAGDKPWPALTQLSGELVFDRASMAVRNAQGRVAGHPRMQLQQIEARIPNLSHTRVEVKARAQGELAEMLGFVAGSPVAGFTQQVLDHAQGSGAAQLQLQLDLPIDHLEQSKVQGSVALAGNSLRLMPEVPLLSQIRGNVQFSDTGFSLAGVQAQALGGPLRFEGGMQVLPASAPASQSPLALRASGSASAEGLRAAPELGLLADIAGAAQGQADYVLDLGVRRGTPEITVTSNLQGLALDLPSPLGKTAAAALPLRFAHTLAPSALVAPAASKAELPPLHDEITLQWGDLASLHYVRDAGTTPAKVLRGALAIGSPLPSVDMPARGVHAQVAMPAVDVDAWQQALQRLSPSEPAAAAQTSTTAASAASLQSYLPDTATLSAQSFTANGRTLHALSARGTRNGGLWNATVEARELSGQIEYREGHAADPAGQVYARLTRLAVPQSAVSAVDSLLSPQPRSLPALDIAVDALELFGRPMGRFEVQARNRESPGNPALREWQLIQFNITSPEAQLRASGSWALQPGQPAQPRTALRFALDIADTGALLTRFSMPGVIRNGRGRLDGQVAWNGSPLSPDYHSLNGQMHLDMASGQFLQAEPGLAKLLGVLSLQALPRRLTLDFRDVFSKGFSFDFVRGDVQIAQGIARTNNLQMKGVNAAVLMEGEADMHRETQNLHVVVVPEINAGTASLVATAINPVVGLSSFLAQILLRGPLIAAATKEFRIDGSWSDPQVNPVSSKPEPRASTPPPTRGETPP